MKKTAILLTVLLVFSLALTSCSGALETGDATEETTTEAPVAELQEGITEAVLASENTAETASENASESFVYVG